MCNIRCDLRNGVTPYYFIGSYMTVCIDFLSHNHDRLVCQIGPVAAHLLIPYLLKYL